MGQLFPIFYPNLQLIVNHNMNKNKTYTLGINHLAFISDEEFESGFLGAKGQNCSAAAQTTLKQKLMKKNTSNKLPDYINWTEKGVVAPVKDQRHCGSCWAFSATAAMESHWSIRTQTSPKYFSEQQLIDCAWDYENNGCSGGLPSQAFEYIRHQGGQEYEYSYPYVGVQSHRCQYNEKQRGGFAIGGSYNVTYQDEQELQDVVATKGPVSVAFQVLKDLKFYKSGVYSNPECSTKPQDVNHAVLATGYGEENGKKYWLIKNSWSTHFGDQGYFKMERGVNMCGVADCAAYPIISPKF